METVEVDEAVRVGVAFDRRKAVPVWFLWKSRYYRIREVSSSWCTSRGIDRLYHYSVTDGTNMYELQFNSNTLEWTLGRICAG